MTDLKTPHDIDVSGWTCTFTPCLYPSWLACYNVDCYCRSCVRTLHKVMNMSLASPK